MNEKDLAVLDQYELTVKEIYRGRGSYICVTDQGKKLLLEYHGSERKARLQQKLLGQLIQSGYPNVDVPISNQNGDVVTRDKDGNRFLLKDWMEGKPCDVCKEEQLRAAMANLACIHKGMQGVAEGQPVDDNGNTGAAEHTFSNIAARRNKELKKVRAFVRGKKSKTDFELYFLQYFPMFYEKGIDVERRLSEEAYVQLHRQAQMGQCFRHGEYSQHNVLFTETGIATVNFERYVLDVQIEDVVYFMRKILEKYDWDERLGFRMLETYEKEKGLTAVERSYLALRLAYPEKFWKLSNGYYNRNKAWISGRNTSKLVKLVVQETAKEYFVRKIQEK